MATNYNFLTRGTYVVFTVGTKKLEYIVMSSYMVNINGLDSYIFSVLGMDTFSKRVEFLERCYGYRVRRQEVYNGWPDCIDGDYEALARVVIGLDRIIRQQYPEST